MLFTMHGQYQNSDFTDYTSQKDRMEAYRNTSIFEAQTKIMLSHICSMEKSDSQAVEVVCSQLQKLAGHFNIIQLKAYFIDFIQFQIDSKSMQYEDSQQHPQKSENRQCEGTLNIENTSRRQKQSKQEKDKIRRLQLVKEKFELICKQFIYDFSLMQYGENYVHQGQNEVLELLYELKFQLKQINQKSQQEILKNITDVIMPPLRNRYPNYIKLLPYSQILKLKSKLSELKPSQTNIENLQTIFDAINQTQPNQNQIKLKFPIIKLHLRLLPLRLSQSLQIDSVTGKQLFTRLLNFMMSLLMLPSSFSMTNLYQSAKLMTIDLINNENNGILDQYVLFAQQYKDLKNISAKETKLYDNSSDIKKSQLKEIIIKAINQSNTIQMPNNYLCGFTTEHKQFIFVNSFWVDKQVKRFTNEKTKQKFMKMAIIITIMHECAHYVIRDLGLCGDEDSFTFLNRNFDPKLLQQFRETSGKMKFGQNPLSDKITKELLLNMSNIEKVYEETSEEVKSVYKQIYTPIFCHLAFYIFEEQLNVEKLLAFIKKTSESANTNSLQQSQKEEQTEEKKSIQLKLSVISKAFTQMIKIVVQQNLQHKKVIQFQLQKLMSTFDLNLQQVQSFFNEHKQTLFVQTLFKTFTEGNCLEHAEKITLKADNLQLRQCLEQKLAKFAQKYFPKQNHIYEKYNLQIARKLLRGAQFRFDLDEVCEYLLSQKRKVEKVEQFHSFILKLEELIPKVKFVEMYEPVNEFLTQEKDLAESGFIMEKRIFPNLLVSGNQVSSKDFEILEKLTEKEESTNSAELRQNFGKNADVPVSDKIKIRRNINKKENERIHYFNNHSVIRNRRRL